jgi:TRAP transporter TAXI family solute receptor
MGCLLVAFVGTTAFAASLPKSVNIGSNPSGSLFYALASGVAATISTHGPFKAEPAPYSGSSTFLPLLNEGRELDFGINNAVDMAMAYRGPQKLKIGGRNPFTHTPNARLAVRGGAMTVAFHVPKSSDIRHVRDLKGRKVAGEYPAHLAVWYNGFGSLSSCGMDWSDVNVVPVPAVNDGFDALKARRVEAAIHAVGSGKVREVNAAIGIRALSICDDEASKKRLMEAVPGYYASQWKAGSTAGVLEDISAVSYDVYLTTHKRMSNQAVYEAVKALWNGQKTLFGKHPILKRWKSNRFASTEVVMAYHPGAIQFYKEMGVWTSDMEKKQQELLRLAE